MSFFVLFQGSDRVVHPDNDQPIEMRLRTQRMPKEVLCRRGGFSSTAIPVYPCGAL